MQELLKSVVASDRSRAADMPAKWGDTLYPDYDFVYSFAKRRGLVLRRTMELSSSKAKIRPEDIIEWRRLIMQVIRSVPGLLEALMDPNRSFNYVRILQNIFAMILFVACLGRNRCPGEHRGEAVRYCREEF